LLLEVNDLRVRYGRTEVVHGASLNVDEGELVALLGRNGAGKTSLLHACVGINKIAAGSITFNGEDVSRFRPDQLVDAGASAALSGHRIFHEQSVRDNLRIGGYSCRRDKGRIAKGIASGCEMFPVLERKLDDPAASLSGGEQQMLAIAQALMPSPRLLLLDEPSAGLAPKLVTDVLNALAKLRQSGLAILVTEQRVDQTLAVSDRAYVMDHGQIAMEGVSSSLRSDPRVREVYMGQMSETAAAAPSFPPSDRPQGQMNVSHE
jgi:branched-chain amino acid transport system ATP-binding protein